MKKLLFALCLATLGLACRASGANMHDTSCTGKDCGDCTEAKAESCSGCPEEKAECESEAAQVCPVTGKTIN